LRSVSKLTNINICFGLTFKEDIFDNIIKTSFNVDYNKIHSDLRYELTYGFEELIPTFLGEFILTKNFPSETEKGYFDILIKLSIEFGVPIFIKLNHFILDKNFQENFIKYFKNIQNNYPLFKDKKKIIFCYSNVKFIILILYFIG